MRPHRPVVLSMVLLGAAAAFAACAGGEIDVAPARGGQGGGAVTGGAGGTNAIGGSGGSGGKSGAGALTACLDRPGELDRPPTGKLPCDLLPPGFGK